MTLDEKINKLPDKIKISDKIMKTDEPIRGIYGIFSISTNSKKCIYIGRAYDIRNRFFSYNGHLSPFFYKNDLEIEKNIVPKIIKEALDDEHEISIELLETVNFGDEKNYYKDMQKLASTECKYIDIYQGKDECLHQLPEGRWISKNNWEENYGPQS